MKSFLLLLLIASLHYSQTTEIYVPDVDGTEYDGQLVKVWDANSGEYYGEQITTNSLAIFDNITSVQTDPISYKPTAGYNPQTNSIYFTSEKSGKVTIVISDILGKSRRFISNSLGGREEIKLIRLGLDNYSNGFYAVRIITPIESYSIGFIKNGINYSATRVNIESRSSASLQKKTLADEIRVEITHEGHYKRTFVAEKSERIEDYVVGYVEQMKTDNTPVTAEEFKQYCWDFNFRPDGSGMQSGFKSFFPNEDKEIWIASRNTLDDNIKFTFEQMENIRDLIIEEVYPFIEEENQPSFYLEDPTNPEPIPLQETGKILIFPRSAGYIFGTGIDTETGVIKYGTIALDDDLDMNDPGPVGEISRAATFEEVASCLMGPRDNQGFPYNIMRTVLNASGTMNPIDIKLFQMGQKIPTKTELDDVLGLE